jgi:hypothetical protein
MGALVEFSGGGSLDGAELELPAHVTGVVTIDRDGRSYYALSDVTGDCHFSGLNEIGATMAGFMRELTAAARAEREAIQLASAAQGCGKCGRTLANAAAFAVHRDDGRCLPDGAYGQLVQVDGVWDSAWRHPELR